MTDIEILNEKRLNLHLNLKEEIIKNVTQSLPDYNLTKPKQKYFNELKQNKIYLQPCKKDAEILKSLLIEHSANENPTYLCSANLTDETWMLAKHVGESRRVINKIVSNVNVSKFRHKDEGKDAYVDLLGALGEVVILTILGKATGLTLAPLVGIKPCATPDISTYTLDFDIKSFDYTCFEFRVNKEAHNKKGKLVDAYIFMQLESTKECNIYLVNREAVNNFKIKTGISDYFYKSLFDL